MMLTTEYLSTQLRRNRFVKQRCKGRISVFVLQLFLEKLGLPFHCKMKTSTNAGVNFGVEKSRNQPMNRLKIYSAVKLIKGNVLGKNPFDRGLACLFRPKSNTDSFLY